MSSLGEPLNVGSPLGDYAAIEAGMRADQLLAEGDVDNAATCRGTIRAIEELQRIAPREGEAVN